MTEQSCGLFERCAAQMDSIEEAVERMTRAALALSDQLSELAEWLASEQAMVMQVERLTSAIRTLDFTISEAGHLWRASPTAPRVEPGQRLAMGQWQGSGRGREAGEETLFGGTA
jgi:hypothetical protein